MPRRTLTKLLVTAAAIGANFLLFDVAADPGARNDLTAAHPDLVRKLDAAIADWEKDVDAGKPVTRPARN